MVDDPAHYRWTSYRANGLGQANSILTLHPLYLSLGMDDTSRQKAYRALFRAQLDKVAVDDIRLALAQNQPLGNERFYAKIEKLTGLRREARPRGRPRILSDEDIAAELGQGELGLQRNIVEPGSFSLAPFLSGLAAGLAARTAGCQARGSAQRQGHAGQCTTRA